MSFALRSLARERAFALALLSSIVVLLFGRTLLHGLALDWWTAARFLSAASFLKSSSGLTKSGGQIARSWEAN